MLSFILGFLLAATSLFLILLVLVQRGRGGGLTGALGGAGGQSAFGSKAGDVFTKITIGVACGWLILCIATIKILNGSANEVRQESIDPAGSVGASADDSGTGTGTGTGPGTGTGTGTGTGGSTTTPGSDSTPSNEDSDTTPSSSNPAGDKK